MVLLTPMNSNRRQLPLAVRLNCKNGWFITTETVCLCFLGYKTRPHRGGGEGSNPTNLSSRKCAVVKTFEFSLVGSDLSPPRLDSVDCAERNIPFAVFAWKPNVKGREGPSAPTSVDRRSKRWRTPRVTMCNRGRRDACACKRLQTRTHVSHGASSSSVRRRVCPVANLVVRDIDRDCKTTTSVLVVRPVCPRLSDRLVRA